MSTIEHDLEQIRSAIYGREVRESIADGIEQCYEFVAGSIRFDEAQTIDEEDQAQARANIGANFATVQETLVYLGYEEEA